MTRIAMWSGPRNISTALMRSWGARSDCFVSDEPLYAHYLSAIDEDKRREHPAHEEVMRSQPTDWREVAAYLTGPIPNGKQVWYQKHMSHHLTEGMGRDWIAGLTNCFLIREPAAMITSFIKIIDNPTPTDLGLPQQVELFQWLQQQTGETPTVIDSRDVLMDPAGMLAKVCERVGVAFDASMLAWEPGGREEDGVWAPRWYSSVYQSTGFAPYQEKHEPVPERLRGVLEECNALYETLAAHKIRLES
ncbi:MAG: sulfotransferase family protein [Phycisphaerae bacterium]|nr:sulfotransferase family protein [Phycisphaerae bacterium]MBM91247.1 sulfotransferase family protein [Phycisphaerae bacterium]HCT44906.1 sulfotransferase family protein [Phycisphaerales bacterium]